MSRISDRAGGMGLLAALLLTACSGAARAPGPGAPVPVNATPSGSAPAPRAYTDADVAFMSGMIGHHAQAVVMAGWAPSHGASLSVRALCERIVVAQRDEIGLMQRWLRDRHEVVPEADPSGHTMPGMDHPMLMPGMLTAAQMAELDAARGPEFDRLFLRYMIQHHQGAIMMVETLMGSRGAAQDDLVFKFAADVNADQTTEIDRMTTMLTAMGAGGKSP